MHIAKELYNTQNENECIPKDFYAPFHKAMVVFPRRGLAFLTVAISLSIFWLLLSFDRLSFDRLPSFLPMKFATTSTSTTHWHGWTNVDNLIVLYATRT